MADRISPSELPLPIAREQSNRPRANKLPLHINKELGSLDSYTYVFSGRYPLRIENRVSDKPPSNALPLTINRPHNTVLPARYVSTKAIPLAIDSPLSEQPAANKLPLAINREHGTVVADKSVKPQAQEIALAGWQSSVVGDSWVRYENRKVTPADFESALYGAPTIRVEVSEGYFPANRLKLPIAVSTAIRPPSSELPLSIYREHGQWLNRPSVKPTNRKYIYPKTFVDGAVAAPNLSLYQQHAKPKGIDSLVVGLPVIKNSKDFVTPKGWQSSQLSNSSSVINRNQRITTESWVSSATASPKIYNLLQYAPLQGLDSSTYGKPYLQGGIKYLSPRGYDSSAFGRIDLLNTTADQYVKLKGANSLVVPAPNVSPRILYAVGIASPLISMPDVRDQPLNQTALSH